MRIGHIWHQTSLQIDLYSGQSPFKHLAEFTKFLLLIPHSNSYCDSIFSTIRQTCTDGRHNLGKDPILGHPFTSVYKDTTSIRNNLLEILIPKINIFGNKKLACYVWDPTKSILAQAKSATCKNLQDRKKQQQKAEANKKQQQNAEANENPEE